MIVVDSVSKTLHFISTYIIVSAEEVARLFLHNEWKFHSLPTYIVLDMWSLDTSFFI